MIRLISFLVWSLGYFYLSSIQIVQWRSFHVFHIRDWKDLFTHLNMIDTPREYVFCVVLLLWIPVWIMGSVFILKLLKPHQKTAPIQRSNVPSHPFIPEYVPANMPAQGKTTAFAPPVESENPDENDQTSENTLVPKNAQLAAALDKITQLAEAKGLTTFPHVLLENILVPVTVSSDSEALLINILADEGVWKVTKTNPVQDSTWTNGNESQKALSEIVLGRGILSKMEEGAIVHSVLVLAKGTLENETDVVEWLKQNDVDIVRLPDNIDSSLPDLSVLLDIYFTIQISEEKDETTTQE